MTTAAATAIKKNEDEKTISPLLAEAEPTSQATASVKRVQAYFYLPENVINELKKRASQRELSKFVADALQNEFRRRDFRNDVKKNFGVLKPGKKSQRVKKS